MGNIKTMGKCKLCKRRGEVIERITSDKGRQKVILVCTKCENRENKEIIKKIGEREKLDDGIRYSQAEVMQILAERQQENVLDFSREKVKLNINEC